MNSVEQERGRIVGPPWFMVALWVVASLLLLGTWGRAARAETGGTDADGAARAKAGAAGQAGRRATRTDAAGFSGAASRVVLGVERFASVTGWRSVSTWSDASKEYRSAFEGTNVNLLWSGCSSVNCVVNPYVAPRLAFDVFLFSNVTVGLSVGYVSFAGDTTATSRLTDGKAEAEEHYRAPTAQSWMGAARAGYVVPLGGAVSVWLRAGISLQTAKLGADAVTRDGAGRERTVRSTYVTNGLGIALDPVVVVVPVEHVGIAMGPVLDIGVLGSSRVKGTATQMDERVSSVGGAMSLMVFF